MLTAFAWLSIAQVAAIVPATPEPMLLSSIPAIEGEAVPAGPNEVLLPQEVRPLPGQLNDIPVFNSNSPEVVQQPGILLSTFPPNGMVNGEAHLNFPFEGRFDLFAHHIARGVGVNDRRTLFIGAVVYNPNSEPVTLEVLQGASYLSQEAPFRSLPALVSNPGGDIFAGPGSRTVTDILQGRSQAQWPEQVTIPPEQAYLLMNAPIPLQRFPFSVDATVPPGTVLATANTTLAAATTSRQVPSNGRSVLMQLASSGPVYAASLSMYAPQTSEGFERAPTLEEWLWLLVNGELAGPRDIPPTNPEAFRKGNPIERFYYSRVAGVTQGSEWIARLADEPDGDTLTIPNPGESFSYVINTVDHNTYGTEQIQSAPMLVRYGDTAYRAHGNYGVHYKLALPLYNDTEDVQRVEIKLQTPLQDETLDSALRFRQRPGDRIFFRGTVRLRYETNVGLPGSRDIHVVQRQGQEGEPILQLTLPPGDRSPVDVELIYPPDATPPHVLTVTTVSGF
ncbi:MAG: DUF3370 domain-containing protein [Cyanobacteria bacterium J06639_14]